MKQININLYSFDELSDAAKSFVCDKEREDVMNNYGVMAMETDAEERIDTLNEFCKLYD